MKRFSFLRLACCLTAGMALPAMAGYPEKPITYQIPLGPGAQSEAGDRVTLIPVIGGG